MKKHFGMMESYLATSPYLCGEHLTGADIMLAYPLIAGKEGGMYNNDLKWDKDSFEETYPKVSEYIDRLAREPGWLKSIEKIKDVEGSFKISP